MRSRIPASWSCRKTRSGSERATNHFLDSLRARHISEGTLRDKRRQLLRFRLWLHLDGRDGRLTGIGEESARAYRLWLSQHYSPTTWNPILGAVAQFFRWAAQHDLLLLDPFEHVRRSPMQRTLPPYLTQKEMKAVLDVCDPELQLRDRAVLEVLYSSALRIRELVRLDLSDVDFTSRTLLVREGKGKKDRVVPLGRIAAKLTQRYVQTVRVAAPSDVHALFLDDLGNRVTIDGVTDHILAPAVRGAGISKHVTAHVLRHSCAIHLLENGAGVRYVQQLLGHAKISTTQRYTNVVPIELKKVHRHAHPAEHQMMPPPTSPVRLRGSKWDVPNGSDVR